MQLKTQSSEYWSTFALGPDDIDFLRSLLLDSEQPMVALQLAEAIVAERCRREEAQLRTELAKGVIYQPMKEFAIGETLIFPALDYRMGQVVGVRPGENPEFGEFDVITIDFGPDRRKRSFASRLQGSHRLNTDTPNLVLTGELASPESLLATVAASVPRILASELAERPDFVQFEGRWFLRDLLADVHVGHLNIAEAIIEMRAAPIDSAVLVKELDLPTEIRPEIAAFSFHCALAADQRFDQVGSGDTHRWYLRRLEPPEALVTPQFLVPAGPFEDDPKQLPPALRQLEWELDDEWSAGSPLPVSSARAGSLASATLLLTYPHLVSGTLPLNRRSRPFFPEGLGERSMVTLVDGRWGQRFSAWAVYSGRYVAGLKQWYEQHKLPVGALVTLERREEDEVVLDFRPKRMRREWTRWAHVSDGSLQIQLRKQEIACEYDELLIIGEEDLADLERLRTSPAYAEAPLAKLVYEVFTGLAGLSTQGTVHAKTVYSTVNALRRVPPGPVFRVLTHDSRYESAGGEDFRLAV